MGRLVGSQEFRSIVSPLTDRVRTLRETNIPGVGVPFGRVRFKIEYPLRSQYSSSQSFNLPTPFHKDLRSRLVRFILSSPG